MKLTRKNIIRSLFLLSLCFYSVSCVTPSLQGLNEEEIKSIPITFAKCEELNDEAASRTGLSECPTTEVCEAIKELAKKCCQLAEDLNKVLSECPDTDTMFDPTLDQFLQDYFQSLPSKAYPAEALRAVREID